MPKQLLLNRGFENGLTNYYIQGKVTTYSHIAFSGTQSALLLADSTTTAELSQIIFFVYNWTPLRFSFHARKFYTNNSQGVSNIRAEVNFISPIGTHIPPGIFINIRGRDITKTWNRYEEYIDVPFGTVTVQVVVRLDRPISGTSGLLVDDLALIAEPIIPIP
ncbi:MAG: hypothetical protein FH756_14480 [Firmicutes bacterium]|nr:hypothetical protein [Bacillota bacterium]